MRGLKSLFFLCNKIREKCRTLAGAWIEIYQLGGKDTYKSRGRTLAGAWIEIDIISFLAFDIIVAP